MALGYALLHPARLELSIQRGGRNRLLDEFSDAIFGTMAVGGDLGRGFEEYVDGRVRAFQGFVDTLRPWLEPGGPLGRLSSFIEGGGGIPDVGALLDRLTESADNVPAFKETIRSTLYAFIDGLPEATSLEATLYLREQFNALTEVFESPLRAGRTDRAAYRGFRCAVVLRQVLGPFFEQTLSAAVIVDLRTLLKRFVDDLIARIEVPEIDRLLAILASFRTQFGGLLTAFANFSASFSVSVSVSTGPEGMPDPPLTADQIEALAVTHPPGHALWWLDLITGVFCTFSATWEMWRSHNFKDREADGVLNVIGILWQAVQTLLRALGRDRINQRTPEENDGRKFLNWLFSDQATLAINLLFRFLGSIHDMLRGLPNWALGFTPSFLKYYSNVINTRTVYYTARSYWYFQTRKEENATTAASLTRTLWAVWGPAWLFSSLMGLIPAWEDFSLEEGIWDEARTLVPLILTLLGPAAGYIILWQVSGKNPFTEIDMAPDWPTWILMSVLLVIGAIALITILANLESGSLGTAVGFSIVLGVLVLVPLVAMPFIFRAGDEGAANNVFLTWLIIGAGLVVACALPFFLWWFYIDDGRDKLGYFEGKNANTSPYLLPYRAGDNWMCGQGVHGMFSHYPVPLDGSESDNHYSYDFNEGEDKPALAARGGIVINVVTGNANGTDSPNSVDVQHVSWVAGHDPGTDQERVLTFAEYVHLSQNRAWAAVGQRIVQGYHVCDIDNTGRSALNHLHFNVAEMQRVVTDVTYPVIFADTTLRKYRNFPLITSWWSGGGHFDGKPMSMAFYESTNTEAGVVVNPILVRTSPPSAPGIPDHSHLIEIDRRTLGTGAIPASITVRTRDEVLTPGLPAHSHTMTINEATLRELLANRAPSGFTTDSTDGHTHGFGAFVPIGRAPQPALQVVEPPPGMLLATRPGPYNLVGDQLVIRVNERATEYYLFGAHRPDIVGDVALDRGVLPGLNLRIDTFAFQLPPGTADATVRGMARLLNAQLRTSGPPVVLRCRPSIVIESRRRGRRAQLEVTFRTPAARAAAGTGAFDDISQIAPGDLAAHIDAFLKNPWPAAPAGLTAITTADGRVGLAIAGAAVDVSASSSRIAEVFTGLYDAASRHTRGRGPMPLGTGRLVCGGGGPTYQVPFLASHGEVRIDTADAAFNATNLTATPLVITALGVPQNVALQTGDNAPDALARRINTRAEGVRAFVDGSTVVVQTVAGGSSASVSASKAPTGALGSPVAGANAATANPLTDSTAVSADTFVSLIDDAGARSTLPYDPAAVTPQARIDGGRLALEVGTGHTIAIAAARFTGTPPFTFTAAGTTRQQTAPLAAPIQLSGPGWIDVDIDGAPPVRVPLDGESARIDLPPLDRMPAVNETLTFAVNGGAAQTVTFTGTEASVADVAAAIARTSTDMVVRIAYVLSIENAFYQNPGHVLRVTDAFATPSPGLPGAGFLRPRNLIQANAIGTAGDLLAVTTNFSNVSALPRTNGGPVRAFTVTETPSGADRVWQLQPGPGLTIRATPRNVADPSVPDPLGFPTAFAATISTGVVPPALDMRAQCREYEFEVQNPDAVVVADATMQISGEPAMIRSLNLLETANAAVSRLVNVTVIDPASTERTIAVDLTGTTTIDDVAQAFDHVSPAVRAWVASPASAAAPAGRLHIETAGAGTGWRLRMDNAPMLLALGFGQDDVDVGADRLEVRGRGTVANMQAVTHDEIRAAFDRAVACTTGVLSRSFTVFADAGNVVLRSLTGAVTIETQPPSLRALLNVTEGADRTTLAPGAVLSTGNGTIIVKVNGRTTAVAPIWGDHASVRANRDLASIAADEPATTAMLALLQTQSIVIRVDGIAHVVPPVPAPPAPPGAAAARERALHDAVEWIAGQVPEAWVGLTAGRVTVESRGAGSAHTIEVNLAAFAAGGFPASTILGFEAGQLAPGFIITGVGAGSVRRLANIPAVGASSLERLLRARAAEGAAPQTIYDAELDTSAAPTRIRLRTHVPAWTLRQATPLPATGPGSIPFLPPGGGAAASAILEAAYPAPQSIEPGEFTLTASVDPGAGGTRRVTVVLLADPAPLPALAMPTSVASLNGKGFDLTVGATTRPVRFVTEAATTPAQMAALIERQCGWTVRAGVTASGLVIETVETGSAKTITLAAPAAPTPNAITNDAATGFTLARALPVQEFGSGSVPAMDAVSAVDFQGLLARAYLDDDGVDTSNVGDRPLNWRPYDALGPTGPLPAPTVPLPTPWPPALPVPRSTTIASRRDGCVSAIDPIVDLVPSLAFRRSMARAPAVRGSVALPAFTSPKTLNGTLSIQLNDNPGIPDIAAPVVVPVAFPAGTYSARDVAARIHDELWERGIGQAAAYSDGTVVIESRVNGVAGTVRIPAPGTATSGADQALLRELLGSATELFGRGYPGAGVSGPNTGRQNGARSRPGAATANATWTFQSGPTGPSTTPIPITAGQSLADIQRAVDSALAAVAGGRIGICVLGPDDTLYVEQVGPNALMLNVNGAPLPIAQPQNPGDTPDTAPDPAVGLRLTTTPRTVRYARDRVGNAVEGDFDDCGWVRVPIHPTTGQTAAALRFPGGRYWTSIRNDAAKTREYHTSGDMIVSGGVDPADPTQAFVHQVRYWIGWIGLGGGQVLGIVRHSSGEFLVEVLW